MNKTCDYHIIKASYLFLVFCFLTFGLKQALCHFLGETSLGIDDANIFMVYAKNLASGDGLVYNSGCERVEGFTSFLYVLLMSPFFIFNYVPEFLIGTMNAVLLSTTLCISFILINRLELAAKHHKAQRDRKAVSLFGTLIILWVFSSPSFLSWSLLSLMETSLWTSELIFFVLSLTFLSRWVPLTNRICCLIICLLVLTRPESMLITPAMLFGYILLQILFFRKPISKAIFDILPAFCTFILSLSLLTLFRLLYFGYPFPNTYYAKVSPSLLINISAGSQYFLSFVKTNPIALISIVLSFIIVLFFLIRKSKTDNSRSEPMERFVFFSACIVIIGSLIPVITGGDHFVWHRFYQPIWPFYIIPIFGGFFFWPKTKKLLNIYYASGSKIKFIILLIISLVFILGNHPSWFNLEEDNSLSIEWSVARESRDKGSALSYIFDEFMEKPSVGVIAAGGIKLEYKGRIIDLMGLNNLEMGHSKGDRKGLKNHSAFNKEVFWNLRPNILFPILTLKKFPSKEIFENSFRNKVLGNLFSDKKFKDSYTACSIKRKDISFYIGCFVENSYLKKHLESLQEHGSEDIFINIVPAP